MGGIVTIQGFGVFISTEGKKESILHQAEGDWSHMHLDFMVKSLWLFDHKSLDNHYML